LCFWEFEFLKFRNNFQDDHIVFSIRLFVYRVFEIERP